MNAEVRELVRGRAGRLCEYCHLHEDAAPFLTFHVEHVRARQHLGGDEPSNLAYACPFCNRKKGPNLATVAAETGKLIALFNPRLHQWDENFAVVGLEIVGMTEIGKATVQLLGMNDSARVGIRAQLSAEGLS